jgi:hypothetical protein
MSKIAGVKVVGTDQAALALLAAGSESALLLFLD